MPGLGKFEELMKAQSAKQEQDAKKRAEAQAAASQQVKDAEVRAETMQANRTRVAKSFNKLPAGVSPNKKKKKDGMPAGSHIKNNGMKQIFLWESGQGQGQQ